MREDWRIVVSSMGAPAILLLAFMIISFLVINDKDSNFWCGYIQIVFSFLCLIAECISSASNGESMFVNAPGIMVTIVHLIVQMLFGIATMAIKAIQIKYSVAIAVGVFAVYGVSMGALHYYKRLIKENK